MPNLLRLDTSARLDGSHSRKLGDYYEKRWLERNPEKQSWLSRNPASHVVRRDLSAMPIGHIAQMTITGFYTPQDKFTPDLSAATALSDQLVGELRQADTLLITTPMYNFSLPSALKAWIDQIVRIGHTFSFDGENFGGLVQAEEAVVICAYGASGYEEGGAFRVANFVEPYLTFLLGFLGIATVKFVGLQGTTGDEAKVAAGLKKAHADIDAIFA